MLYNSTGQIVKWIDHISNTSMKIDATTLSPGLYLFKLFNEENTIIENTPSLLINKIPKFVCSIALLPIVQGSKSMHYLIKQKHLHIT